MSSRTFISVIILSLVYITMAKVGRLGRIENDIKSLDHKLKAYSLVRNLSIHHIPVCKTKGFYQI